MACVKTGMPDRNEMQLFAAEEMGGIPLEDVFAAYFDCRKRKRNTYNALAFEREYEKNCIELWKDINSGTYEPRRSIAFVVFKPVQREIFAADFRDRVVHHLIAGRIVPLLEKRFIVDSYSTRTGKGTLFGIRRIEEHIRACSEGWTRDCYIMKIDIRAFFMQISRSRLYDKIKNFLDRHYQGNDLPLLLFLLRKTIFNRPEKNCIRRSPPSYWRGLPRDKSLFHSCGERGLPIGNLTSQLLALYYMDELDHLITEQWGVPHYGRYVDDMVLVHRDAAHLLDVRSRIQQYLEKEGLSLHPRKFYLQHYTHGVQFVGGFILPGRVYLSRKSLGFCLGAVDRLNRRAEAEAGFAENNAFHFVSVLNSYLGLMKHFSSYRLKRKVMLHIGKEWWKVMYISGHIEKAVTRKIKNHEGTGNNETAGGIG